MAGDDDSDLADMAGDDANVPERLSRRAGTAERSAPSSAVITQDDRLRLLHAQYPDEDATVFDFLLPGVHHPLDLRTVTTVALRRTADLEKTINEPYFAEFVRGKFVRFVAAQGRFSPSDLSYFRCSTIAMRTTESLEDSEHL